MSHPCNLVVGVVPHHPDRVGAVGAGAAAGGVTITVTVPVHTVSARILLRVGVAAVAASLPLTSAHQRSVIQSSQQHLQHSNS